MQGFRVKALLAAICFVVINSAADAGGQQGFTYVPTGSAPSTGVPYQAFGDLGQGLEAARSGDIERARAIRQSLTDPVARKIVLWAMVDAAPTRLPFFELDAARRELAGFPREPKRQASAERALEGAGLSPAQVIAWFVGRPPASAEGAMALASAYQGIGREAEARELIRGVWRDKVFEADVQSRLLARFGALLTAEDNVARADMLLYGAQGPAAQAMISLLPYDKQASARARMALRANASNANVLVGALSPGEATSPGVAFERARYLRKHNLDALALGMAPYFPKRVANPEIAGDIWLERRLLVNTALKSGNYAAAYQAAADSGLPPGPELAEAEFYAGWVALKKLHNPREAERHFARVAEAGASPITQSRAFYWRGRASEAQGDYIEAQTAYAQAAHYPTAFYGQLGAEKVGQRMLTIGSDPVITAADRRQFEDRDMVRAIRLLFAAHKDDTARVFMARLDDDLNSAADYAMLVDLARGSGDQFGSMLVVRAGAQRGFILPERGYPVAGASTITTPERAFVLGIVRQESSFDPHARSGAGARGMMQLMPGTASGVARRIGLSYSASLLEDPEYNIKVGSAFLGDLVDDFSGSYPMAAAGYNAGPGRPPQWVATCGDPRASSSDPLDFIECIPFSETRNYVMRVMENMQVYRARLNGGTGPLTLTADLKRGSYAPHPYVASNVAQAQPAGSMGTMAPIAD